MPTYEYRCKDCAHTFEAYQSFTDDPLTECVECGGPVKKVFGNVGIAFKGSGFYKTDSRGGAAAASGATTPASSEPSPANGSSPSTEGSSTPSTGSSEGSSSPSKGSSEGSSSGAAPAPSAS